MAINELGHRVAVGDVEGAPDAIEAARLLSALPRDVRETIV
jgi:hypothetical protein